MEHGDALELRESDMPARWTGTTDTPARRPTGLARFGYACIAGVYALAGVTILRAAVLSGRVSHRHDAPGMILRRPWALGALGLIAVGLAGYAVAQLVAGLVPGRGHRGSRVMHTLSGVLHGALAALCGELLLHLRHPPSGRWTEEHWSAQMMEESWGVWVVGALGAALIVGAVLEFVHAQRMQRRPQFGAVDMSPARAMWTAIVAQVGVAARGAVFGLAGVFFLRTAWLDEMAHGRGFTPALAALHRSGFGPVTMGAVGLGLLAYVGFAALRARFGPPPAEPRRAG